MLSAALNIPSEHENVKLFEPQQRLAYGIDDVIRLTGIGRTKVFEAIRDGKLTAVKVGSRTLVRNQDLCAWLDALPIVEPRIARSA